MGSYIIAYNKHDGAFNDKASNAIAKLRSIQDRADTIPSCTHEENKFENRRLALVKALKIALPAMSAGKFLASSVKDDLKHHEE